MENKALVKLGERLQRNRATKGVGCFVLDKQDKKAHQQKNDKIQKLVNSKNTEAILIYCNIRDEGKLDNRNAIENLERTEFNNTVIFKVLAGIWYDQSFARILEAAASNKVSLLDSVLDLDYTNLEQRKKQSIVVAKHFEKLNPKGLVHKFTIRLKGAPKNKNEAKESAVIVRQFLKHVIKANVPVAYIDIEVDYFTSAWVKFAKLIQEKGHTFFVRLRFRTGSKNFDVEEAVEFLKMFPESELVLPKGLYGNFKYKKLRVLMQVVQEVDHQSVFFPKENYLRIRVLLDDIKTALESCTQHKNVVKLDFQSVGDDYDIRKHTRKEKKLLLAQLDEVKDDFVSDIKITLDGEAINIFNDDEDDSS